MDPVLHDCISWTAAAAGSLVAATWEGLALAASIALCLRVFPIRGAAERSLLWMAAFLLTALFHLAALAPWSHPSTGSGADGVILVSPAWGVAIAFVWGGLSLYRAAHLALCALRLRVIAQRATTAPCAPACQTLLSGGRRLVQLCTSLDVDRPSVIGFHAPRILLPPGLLAELSPHELEQVLLHELEHLRRADDWTNLLQKLVLVIFPLNPVLLWIEHRLCTERELACDDGVLRRTRARKAYASCLTRLSEYSMVRRSAELALGAWEKQSELSRRVYRILSQPETQARSRMAGVVTGVMAVLVLAGAAVLAHSRPVVSFASVPSAVTKQMTRADIAPLRFHPAAAHLSNVSMVTPQPRALRLRHRHPGTLRPRALVARTPQDQDFVRQPLSRHPWLVLANWSQTVPHGNLRLPEQENLWPTFAAVPTAGGWLIIEL